MLDLVVKALKNPHHGALYVRFQEALVQQLLCNAIALAVLPPGAGPASCSERELRALRSARALLLERLSDPPNVCALARLVGLPQKALTQRFRALYGETVADFGLRCRMEHALCLLRDRGAFVDEASAAVGYAQPTSFATAFRRVFGLRPSQVKSRPLVSRATPAGG